MGFKLLIFGNGQVGSELWDLIPTEWEAKIVSRNELDFTNDQEKILLFIKEFLPDVVVNAVAYTEVDRAEVEQEIAFQINAETPKQIAQLCTELDILFIHFSTDYVFDGTKKGIYTEQDAPNPLSVYGKTKLQGELYIQEVCKKYVILRTSWLYSNYGHNFVKTMKNLFLKKKLIKVIDDQYGSPTYAKDLAQLTLRIIEKERNKEIPKGGFGVFHCTNQGYTNWFEFSKKIFQIVNKDCALDSVEIEPISSENYEKNNNIKLATRPKNSRLSCKFLRDIYNDELRPWAEALEDMLNKTLTKL